MTRGRIRARLRLSHLYTFACTRPEATEEGPHSIEGPGYSRIVHCNQPLMHKKKPFKYRSNYISTTKYNFFTFLPKALYEQFHRVANLYFLAAAIVSVTPLSPFSAVSMIAPLVFVVGLSMAKEALEDWRRFMQDIKVNSRKSWKKLQVGDVVKVEKDQFFPADLLLLSSSYEDGICYVETMNLDGETNLKVKRALEVTLPLDEDASFKNFTGKIKCEDPNPSLYTFIGNFEYDHEIYALDPSQILLRDSKLRNTAFVYGVVIFTGHDSKVMQNATKSPSKRSRIERKMDYIIYVLFSLLLVISLVSSIGFAVKTKFDMPDWWYLQPQNTDDYYDPRKPVLSGVTHLITALMLYGYLIPISLYVSIEVVKVLQATFINQDIQMYDEETGNPAQARTSNLNEELGQVDTILSDKTGTLTCNQMDFLKCSIAGTAYGMSSSEVELAAAQQMASDLEDQDVERSTDFRQKGKQQEIELETVVISEDEMVHKSPIKGFSFEDSRVMEGNWLNEPNANVIMLFFRILAICHTAVPELNEETGSYTYESESPDEAAFLVAAREFGFEFCKRTQSSVFVRERYSASGQTIERWGYQCTMSAVMASDFSIAQFRFLERLLVVHGHWCYKRIAQMVCYFFYKNIAFGLTLFYFEAFAGFSGQSIYDDWYMLLFNVLLTSLPVISLGVFEQDVSSEFPAVYQQGPKNLFFDWYKILGWMGNGLYSSLIIFFLNIIIFYDQAFREEGQTASMPALGTTMFTCIIWALNCQIAFTMSHFTWIQHLFIWGSIATWYLFLFVYGRLSPSISGNAYQILVEALAPAPIYWLATLLVTIACNLPYLAHISYQRCFHPLDHHIIQEIKYYKKDVEDQRMWTRERSRARERTMIGFSARVDAKIRQLKGKLQRKQPSSEIHSPARSS
ncbi:hypothetical protein GOBAR_AA19081 [Gossypium barbadense]|uniref:Phospholipid-transporting ATPase n=2 Tax=Gossypium barbadense TaxID=3634 RepID=A0A2P5XE36_GOSBA|nr:hypothetical protein GOBAR_AA19081 [Gossypium barbadense]